MRTIEEHIVNPCNDKLTITVADEPGDGGANHVYMIEGADMRANPSAGITTLIVTQAWAQGRHPIPIVFQNGPIPENGINGITQEVLLAIVADRLRSFQAGPYACRENEMALARVEEALHWLQQQTILRMCRGVEGTHERAKL